MRSIGFILLFLMISLSGMAQKDIRVSLITTTPGDLPHTMFGHSALRVTDAENDFDKVYNFGLFDFNAPGFGLKFLKGDLDYWLGRQTIDGFVNLNNREGRLVKEQVLNLTDVQAEGIAAELELMRQEENKFYRYSFTKKNCTTQIRDVFVKFNVLPEESNCQYTKRQLLIPYVAKAPWFKFGINLIMGVEVDRTAQSEQAVFLPLDLKDEVQATSGLVLEENQLNDIAIKKDALFHWNSPLMVFLLLTILFFFYSPNWLSSLVFLSTGLLGCFVLYVSLSSSHTELNLNFNLLWCNPFYLLLFLAYRRQSWRRKFHQFMLFCFAALFLVWIFGIQTFDYAIIPFVFGLTILHKKGLAR